MKKFLSIITALLFVITATAQVEEVTLTTIGIGVDEEQATLQALRSAIEQTFGAFVSSNTTILNDELVKDEIVSVSSGNVKEYKKIAVSALPNGEMSVSINATISINKLISYAKSKGAKAEFEGAIYAANLKLLRLRVSSIRKAYDLMVEQLNLIAKDMFAFKINIESDPVRYQSADIGEVYYFKCCIQAYSDIASTNFFNLYTKTVNELKLTKEEVKLCQNEGIPLIDEHVRDPYYAHDIYGEVVLPFTLSEYQIYKKHIAKCIYDALHRFQIREIDNNENMYSFECFGNTSSIITLGYKYDKYDSEGLVLDYFLESKKWDVCFDFEYMRLPQIGNYDENPFRKFERIFTYSSGYEQEEILISRFALKENKVPIELTKQEQNEVKKGTFKGVTHIITYTDPQMILELNVRLAIPVSDIEYFKGFELVGVSAPIISDSDNKEKIINEMKKFMTDEEILEELTKDNKRKGYRYNGYDHNNWNYNNYQKQTQRAPNYQKQTQRTSNYQQRGGRRAY